MELSIKMQRHDGTELLVVDAAWCSNERDAYNICMDVVRFAHVAGLEMWVKVDAGEWVFYENLEFAQFCNKTWKMMKPE